MGATEGFMKHQIEQLEDENKRLKEAYETCNLDSINRAFKISNLEMENEKLKKENFVMKDRLKFGYKGVAREEIERVEQENKNLKLTLEQMENTCKGYLNDRDTLREENKKLKVKIAKLEFDIEAWKKLKKVWEEKEKLRK